MIKRRPPVSETGHFYIHLVSDATGTTLQGLARACLAQFPDVHPIEKFWNLIRSEEQVDMVLDAIADEPGPVLFTFVNPELRSRLRDGCRHMQLPCVPVLDPIMKGLSGYLGRTGRNLPGLQYEMDDAYFARIDAVDFALHHDDGQNLDGLEDADVILIGVSRTSKTPTAMYLANRGIRAANIPLVPKVDIAEEFLTFDKPLYIGLTESPARLLELRKNRLISGSEDIDPRLTSSTYLAEDAVEEEVRRARQLFSSHGWPVIDVTRRSVEETAAEIMTLLSRRKKNGHRLI